ncbi:MAG: NUDIX domain-containing protein [Microthrixaceae bacterium]
MSPEDQIRMLGDELRVLADDGLRWSGDDPYHRERFHRVRSAAAAAFSIADQRGANEIERSVFSQLTHMAPIPCGDAAIVDDHERILLIQRSDDRLWAMPGGGFNMGETPAQGVAREALEETGLVVEVLDLLGVYDSRFCGTGSALQLYQFVFLCRAVGVAEQSTPQEVLDQEWFARDELPDLSPGHTVRVPDVFQYLDRRRAIFDRPTLT